MADKGAESMNINGFAAGIVLGGMLVAPIQSPAWYVIGAMIFALNVACAWKARHGL